MESLRGHFERAWKGVIAPIQYHYNINSVFPKEERFQGHPVQRIDLTVQNDLGKNISAFIIKEKNIEVTDAVLYFHGNGGTKIEILGAVPHLINQGIALIAFDFVGCGNSDQGYLTYGHNEASDAEIVLREAYKYINVERLAVWGRSMGAVTAINFAAKNPKIVRKLILDSPFRYLSQVINRVVQLQTGMPQVITSLFTHFLCKQIEQKLKYPLFQEDYLHLFRKLPKQLSVMLVCSNNDEVVPKIQVQTFYRAHKGDKELLQINQSHEADRSTGSYMTISSWIKRRRTRKNMKLTLYRSNQALCLENDQVYSIC